MEILVIITDPDNKHGVLAPAPEAMSGEVMM